MIKSTNPIRIVVTGMGCASVLGQSSNELVGNLLAGRSGITRWKKQLSSIYSKIGGDLSDFDLEDHLIGWPHELAERARSILRLSPQAGRLVAVSVFEALESAGALDLGDTNTAHLLGCHNANEKFVFEQAAEFSNDPEHVDSMYGIVAFDTDVLSATNEIYSISGPSFTVGGACASSNVALILAIDLLRSGRVSRVIVSGVAMTTSPLALQGWAFIDALALDTFVDEPHRASRPFDKKREGFVPAEGAGAVVLETLSGARSRGAPIHAELLGGSITSAASRGARTDVDAQRRAIQGALDDAGINGDQVDYVNAHGTSTPLGDLNEMKALRQALGGHAKEVWINSSKSMLGHALQGASILELIATIGQIQENYIHPNLNLEDIDSDLDDLRFVGSTATEHRIKYALSNAFGFGGINAVLAVGRYDI